MANRTKNVGTGVFEELLEAKQLTNNYNPSIILNYSNRFSYPEKFLKNCNKNAVKV